MQRAIVTSCYLLLRRCWDFGLEIFGIVKCLLIKRAGRVATIKVCLILQPTRKGEAAFMSLLFCLKFERGGPFLGSKCLKIQSLII